MEVAQIAAMIIGTSTLVAALTTIFNHIIAFGKLGNSAITRYVNKTMKPHFDEIHKSLDNIKDQLDDIRDENDRREVQRLRYECLKFASEVHKGIHKERGEYEEIFRMEHDYNALIKKHNIENGFMVEEMLFVHESYRNMNISI